MYGKTLICLFIIFLVFSAVEAKDLSMISGRVTWEGGYGFISGATVYIYDLSKTIVDSTRTNLKGFFQLIVPNGQYYVSVEKDNLVKEYYPGVYLVREADTVTVSLGQDIEINFALDSGGWISGTFAYDGADVNSGLVTAIKIDQPDEGWYKSLTLAGPFPSAYAIQGLLPGTYKILGRARGKSTEYYPGVSELGQATAIDVIKDVGISNIGFMLDQVGSGTITGRVYNLSTDQGIADLPLYAYQWHDFWQDPNLVDARSGPDGRYIINIPAGDYFLFSIYTDPNSNPAALYYDNCYDPTSADIIHVASGQTVQGIDFGIDYLVSHDLSISGVVQNHGGGAGLGDVIATAINSETGIAAGSACSIENGYFSIGNLAPGRYLLMFSGTFIIPYFYPQSINWQNGEIIALDGHFGNVRTEAITEDYGNNGLMIAGTVMSSAVPLEGARIYAFPITSYEPIAYARTDASGSYAIVNGLVPGYYNIVCDLYGYNSQNCSYPVYLDLMSNPEALNINFNLNMVSTAVDNDNFHDGRIVISGNYPNPFNSRTLIRIYSDRSEEIPDEISVFNILGQIVGSKAVLLKPGENLIEWSADDFEGSVSSGVYFYRFGSHSDSYRMILLK